jgi:UDP-N-acetyl-D-glucosamine dehydrogenase
VTTESVSNVVGRGIGAELADLETPLADLLRRIRSRTASVAVVGQGYVGFPLAQRAAERGFPTIGLDTSESVKRRCDAMNVHATYRASLDMLDIRASEVIVVAVPTPTVDGGRGRRPNLNYVRTALRAVGNNPHWQGRPRLVVVESTYAPGTTRKLAHQYLFGSGELGQTIAVGYSPERIDPGNAHYSVDNIPKVVSGLCDHSALLVQEFYDAIVEETVPASSVEAAEACKLLENTFRFVNITFAQEFEEYCNAIGVSAKEATDLAATKPFGYMRFHAGPGIGGHCIAEDPYFLHEAMLRAGTNPGVLRSALANHESRARVIVDRIVAQAGGDVAGKRIILLGVSYKPGVADTRRSPASEIRKELVRRGALVSYHDPLVARFEDIESVILDAENPGDYELSVVLVRHAGLNIPWMKSVGWRVFDPVGPAED